MTQYSSQSKQGGTATSAATGVSNPSYNLVSILYHALQAAQTYDTYIHDAEEHGDTQMAQFLRQIQTEDRNRAQYAMQLLTQRSSQGAIR